jgi:Arc/MetJ-type ribon-helix-helix transcriptional regulator
MRTTRQMSVTLPNELALAVRAKATSGEYVSESEVIRDGLIPTSSDPDYRSVYFGMKRRPNRIVDLPLRDGRT